MADDNQRSASDKNQPAVPDAPPQEGRFSPPPPATDTHGPLTEVVDKGQSPEISSEGQTQYGDEQATRQLLTGRAARNLSAESLSPSQIAWRQLRKNRFAMLGLFTLILLYTVALFAPFIAPYPPQEQSPAGATTSYHPPMKIRFTDADGNFQWQPFVYGTVPQRNEFYELDYLPDASKRYPLRFFVSGAEYKLFGLIPLKTRLFGAEGGPIYILGTDEVGRDYFSRLLSGSQISLSVGLIAITITFTLGLLIGGISGFYGGRVDDVIMRGSEVIMSVPDFYLLLALAAALPPHLNPIMVYILIIVILSFVGWAGMARIIRGMVLSVREREYVEAARSLGVSDFIIIVRHILPATFTYAIVAATLSIPAYILGEAGLSFLGLGIREPIASWGNMLSAAQNLTTLESRPWILAPGFAIFITTLAFNFLGDGLRDALDPKSNRTE